MQCAEIHLEIALIKVNQSFRKNTKGYVPDQSAVGGRIAGSFTLIQWKFSFTPRLHALPDFVQFWQFGSPSSHFRWRSLHVKHPVLTLFGFFASRAVSAAALEQGESAAVIWVLFESSKLPTRLLFDWYKPDKRRRFAGGLACSASKLNKLYSSFVDTEATGAAEEGERLEKLR